MIKKIVFAIIAFGTFVSANQIDEIKTMFENEQYSRICSQATLTKYQGLQNSEEFWTIYSESCIEIDLISNIMVPINKLIHSREARENAVFLSTVLYQKKLLYYAIVDDVDISYIRLPKINHMLSVIFDNYVTQNYIKEADMLVFKDDVSTYKLKKIIANDGTNRLVIQTFKDNKLTKTRTYW